MAGRAQPPRNKREMYPLYESGRFGNKLRTWSSLAELRESDYGGIVVLRYAGASGGGFVNYAVANEDIEKVIREWRDKGADPARVRFSEPAPDERLVIQGELADDPYRGGLVLRYSTWKAKMRDAMRFADHEWGLTALMSLRRTLTPPSLHDLRELLEDFPGGVVEFSAYEHTLGTCPGRNAVVWEVRGY